MQRWAAATGLLLLVFFSHTAAGQTDTEFWFVAPEVTALHGDNPVLLRFATFDAPATVTVTQPANPAFPAQVVNIAANAAASINLTAWLGMVENQPFNQVLNKGLRIVSTSPISAYYEVSPSNNFNPEIFVLKGSNALGTQFFTPFQTLMQNNYPSSTAGFDIVATQPNTSVTITPTRDLVGGHPAGVPFTIVLPQAGSTWAGRAASVLGNQHPTGTLISASAPVAVTISDDSVQGTPFNGTCLDINGDQLVPVSLVGDQYIAVRGYLNTSTDRVYIVATSNATQVSINGFPVTTLNTGQGYEYVLSAAAAYITTSADVYVLHITGFGCEVGGALLPSVECTGSQSVAFVRSTSEFFAMNILVPTVGIGNFQFNGNAAQVPAGAFLPVPGTGGAWSYAQITGTGFVPTLAVSRLANTSTPFHLGIINGGSTSGCRYGYFSDYAAYQHETSTSFIATCANEAFALQAEPLPGATYQWTGPAGFAAGGNPVQVAAGAPGGMYYVTGSVGVCPIAPDSVEVDLVPVPEAPDLAGPGVWCQGLGDWIETGVTADAGGYAWSGTGVAPGSNAGSDSLWVVPGVAPVAYGLAVTVAGCTSPVTTLVVTPVPLYQVVLPPGPLAVCLGAGAELEVPAGAPAGADWTWNWGVGGPGGTGGGGGGSAGGPLLSWNEVEESDAGWVLLSGEAGGCAFAPDSLLLDVLVPVAPELELPEVICTDQGAIALQANVPGTWSIPCNGCIDAATGLFTPASLQAGTFPVTFVTTPPCPLTATGTLTVGAPVDAGFTAPATVCVGVGEVVLTPLAPGGLWTANCGGCIDDQGVFDAGEAGPGVWGLAYTQPGLCPTESTVDLLVTPNTSSDFDAPSTLCIDAEVAGLSPAVGGGLWSADCGPCITVGGGFNPSLAGAGQHLVTYTVPGICGSATTQPIAVQALPEVTLSLPTTEGCAPLLVDVTASTTAGGPSGNSWTGGMDIDPVGNPGGGLSISGLNPGPVVLSDPGCYTWVAWAITPAGCLGTASAPSPVCVFPQPSSGFTTSPAEPSLFAPDVLAEALLTDPADTHTWLLEQTAEGEGISFEFNALSVGASPFELCLRVVSPDGCVSQACKSIAVNEGWVTYAPNAFTPDMDGVNDAWRVEVAGEIERFDLRVFDRWGTEVFATQDPNEYWVGEVQDGAYFAPAALYAWRAEIAGRDARGATVVRVMSGHVSLVR